MSTLFGGAGNPFAQLGQLSAGGLSGNNGAQNALGNTITLQQQHQAQHQAQQVKNSRTVHGITSADLNNVAFTTNVETLVNMWTVKFGDKPLRYSEIVEDDPEGFYRVSFHRLGLYDMFERYELADMYETAFRIKEWK